MSLFVDLTGQKFGNLTVIGHVRKRDSAGASRVYWIYRCSCGAVGEAMTGNMKRIRFCKKCGINARSEIRSTHHCEPKRLFNIWNHMKQRCMNPNVPNYKDYGGRGISVCDEWLNDYEAFRDWSFSSGYNETVSIDRIDVNGNYEPSNCRWAKRDVQNNNTRANHYIEFRGETKTIAEWSKITGIDANTIYPRINKYGWPVEEALGFVPHKRRT